MALATGTRLGAYEITGGLGAGGMGEVYRATDTKLGREVAIKTLPSALAQDADRLARFEREAKLLAALNHAHIAAIYGLDEHDGTQYLAMELVEGETLEQKLEAGPLPIEDALRLALQVAEALEAAHEKGVVHRDLKPANVMVTRDGQVKVLDFGLAKAFAGDPDEAAPAHSPALSLAMTQQGLILGTAGYMSPEQASGQATDQRADIWAFGVLLYEMLTGLPLFSGESVPHILAAVLQTEPDWSRLPKHLHPRLKWLLERCLAKKPRNRLHSIADARLEIEAVLSDPRGPWPLPASSTQPASRRTLRVATASALATAGLAALIGWGLWPAAGPQPVSRFAYTLPKGQAFNYQGNDLLALSPDGRRIVYTGSDGVYMRAMTDLDARRIEGTKLGFAPFFSPEGQSIAYFAADGHLKRSAIAGGAPVVLADFNELPYGRSWARDDTIFFGLRQGIYRVSANGGEPELVIPAKEGEYLYGPELLPDGDSVLLSSTRGEGEWDQAQVVAQSLSTGKRTVLIHGGSDAHYVRTGHLIYAQGDALFAVAFDADHLSISGPSVSLVQGVMRSASNLTGAANYAISDDGTLVYVPETPSGSVTGTLVWVDRNGKELGPAVKDSIRNPRNPRLSPDGRRLALITGAPSGGDLWVYDLSGRPPIPLFDKDDNRYPVWSPDGTKIAFAHAVAVTRLDVYIAPADGSVLEPMPLRADGLPALPSAWSSDGNLILTRARATNRDHGDIVATSADGKGEVRDVLVTPYTELDAALSPNGRWLAYASDRTGRPEVWVQAYPNGGSMRVSPSGGRQPVWSRDGDELFYLQGNAMMAVRVETEGDFSFEPPTKLFSGPYYAPSRELYVRSYDVAADGRFLMIKKYASAGDTSQSIVVVQNWLEELKRRVPAK